MHKRLPFLMQTEICTAQLPIFDQTPRPPIPQKRRAHTCTHTHTHTRWQQRDATDNCHSVQRCVRHQPLAADIFNHREHLWQANAAHIDEALRGLAWSKREACRNGVRR